jgi:type I restriction enzyme R subunit
MILPSGLLRITVKPFLSCQQLLTSNWSQTRRNAKEVKGQEQEKKAQQLLLDQVAKLQEEKEAILAKAQESEASLEAYKQQTQQAVVNKNKKQARLKPIATEFTEAQTRQHLIDVDLKEAGWFNLNQGRELEYPVKGMPYSR